MHALETQILKGVKPPLNAVFGRYLPHRQWGTCKKVRNRVGLTGIEPALPKELDPKSSASASSATAPRTRIPILPTECTGQHRWFQPVFKGSWKLFSNRRLTETSKSAGFALGNQSRKID